MFRSQKTVIVAYDMPFVDIFRQQNPAKQSWNGTKDQLQKKQTHKDRKPIVRGLSIIITAWQYSASDLFFAP